MTEEIELEMRADTSMTARADEPISSQSHPPERRDYESGVPEVGGWALHRWSRKFVPAVAFALAQSRRGRSDPGPELVLASIGEASCRPIALAHARLLISVWAQRSRIEVPETIIDAAAEGAVRRVLREKHPKSIDASGDPLLFARAREAGIRYLATSIYDATQRYRLAYAGKLKGLDSASDNIGMSQETTNAPLTAAEFDRMLDISGAHVESVLGGKGRFLDMHQAEDGRLIFDLRRPDGCTQEIYFPVPTHQGTWTMEDGHAYWPFDIVVHDDTQYLAVYVTSETPGVSSDWIRFGNSKTELREFQRVYIDLVRAFLRNILTSQTEPA